MRQDAHAGPLAVDFRGTIPEKVKQYATEKLSKLERYAPRPILHAKLEIQEAANPAIATPYAAKASMDVNGQVLHASVEGTTFEEAIDLVAGAMSRVWCAAATPLRLPRFAPRSGGTCRPPRWRSLLACALPRTARAASPAAAAPAAAGRPAGSPFHRQRSPAGVPLQRPRRAQA